MSAEVSLQTYLIWLLVTLVTDAMCFASYLTVAQGKIYEKFMRGPIYDERVIYYRYVPKKSKYIVVQLM